MSVPVKGPVPWERQEHTAAKHDIYQRYLERWFPIILSQDAWPSATYVEGFSGPGVYIGGHEGSPIIAIRAFLGKVASSSKRASFVFIDDDQRCVDLLWDQLREKFPERPRPPDQIGAAVEKGTCEDLLEPQLNEMGAWGSPIFANLDSWGNVPVSHRLLRKIARNPASEVIVTLEPQHFVRFVTELGDKVDDVFGGDRSWREAADLPSHLKRQFVLKCYRKSLHNAGFTYLLDFELIDKRGNSLYLVFGTNHPLGVQKMKDSLWEVDKRFGVGFRDPKDEQSEALFDLEDPVLEPLARLLKTRLGADGPARVHDLGTWAQSETVFRRQHVIRALRPLLASGEIELDDGSRAIRLGSIVTIS